MKTNLKKLIKMKKKIWKNKKLIKKICKNEKILEKLIYLEKNSYFQNFFNTEKSILNFKIIRKYISNFF